VKNFCTVPTVVIITITVMAKICTAPPIVVDNSASQAEKLSQKYDMRYKVNITAKFI